MASLTSFTKSYASGIISPNVSNALLFKVLLIVLYSVNTFYFVYSIKSLPAYLRFVNSGFDLIRFAKSVGNC